ncbi:hypothetical protein FKM82_021388 [Ascaphus truei]
MFVPIYWTSPYNTGVGGWASGRWLRFVCCFFREDLGKDVEFEVVGDAPDKAPPKPAEQSAKSITNGSDDGAQPSTSTAQEQDDVLIVDSDEESASSSNSDVNMESATSNLKRKLSDDEPVNTKRKRAEPPAEPDDDIIALD